MILPWPMNIRTRFAWLTVVASISLTEAILDSPAQVRAQSPQPVVVASGQFGGVDGFHKGQRQSPRSAAARWSAH
jgi:hypothetical protein